MKLNTKLRPLVLATSVALSATAAPLATHAEVGYSLNIASMYLFRGTDASNGFPAVSGSVDYSHESGFYASLWASSGDHSTNGSGYEVDPIIGYAGEVGDFGYDISYYKVWYPQTGTSLGSAGDEVALGLSYDPVAFTYVIGDTYKYYNVGAGIGAFSLAYGLTDNDSGADPSHIDLGYSATDNLSFTVSLPDDDTSTKDNVLMVISYDVPLE